MPENEKNTSLTAETNALAQEKAMAEFKSIMNDVKGILAADSKDAAAVSKANALLSQAASLDLPQSIINAELAKYPPEIQKAYKAIEQKTQDNNNLQEKVAEARVQFDMATANQIATMSSADLEAFIRIPGNADAYIDQIISRAGALSNQVEKEYSDFMKQSWHDKNPEELKRQQDKLCEDLCEPIKLLEDTASHSNSPESHAKIEADIRRRRKIEEEELRKRTEECNRVLNDPNATLEQKKEAQEKLKFARRRHTLVTQRLDNVEEIVIARKDNIRTAERKEIPVNPKADEEKKEVEQPTQEPVESIVAYITAQKDIEQAYARLLSEQEKLKQMANNPELSAAERAEAHAKAQKISEEIAREEEQYRGITNTIEPQHKAVSRQDLAQQSTQEAAQEAQQEGELPVRKSTRVNLADASLDAQPQEAIQEMQQEGELPVRKSTRLDLATVSLDSQSQEATQEAQQEGELPARAGSREALAGISIESESLEPAQEKTATDNDVSAPVTPQEKSADSAVAANENSSESSEIRLAERVAQNAVAVEVGKDADVDYAYSSIMAMQSDGRN